MRSVGHHENSERLLPHVVQVVKGDPIIFSVAFTERAVAVMGLKQGRYSCATGSSC